MINLRVKQIIFLVAFLFATILSFAQIRAWTPVKSIPGYEYNGLNVDSILKVPTDTVHNKLYGSLAFLNHKAYFKDSAAWIFTTVDLSDYHTSGYYDSVFLGLYAQAGYNKTNWDNAYTQVQAKIDSARVLNILAWNYQNLSQKVTTIVTPNNSDYPTTSAVNGFVANAISTKTDTSKTKSDSLTLANAINLKKSNNDSINPTTGYTTLYQNSLKQNNIIAGANIIKVGDTLSAITPILSSNLVVQIGAGGSVGGVNTGDTLKAGNTLETVLRQILIKTIHPTYNAPTNSINATPAFGYYEIGTNLGTVTLSSGYTQNDGGAASTITYYQNGVSLGAANTTSITSLTTTQSFYVNTAYAQGACKLNNLGVIDCIGQIPAGSVNSGISGYTPFYKRYWGWSNSTAPSNAVILALTQDTNGGTASLTLVNMQPDATQNSNNGQYLVYFTKGTVSSVTVNGFNVTGSYTITTYNVTNAQGYISTYSYVYSNSPQTQLINSIIFN